MQAESFRRAASRLRTRPVSSPTPRLIVLACVLAGLASTSTRAVAQLAPQRQTAMVRFNVPAGSLDQVLNRFATTAGILLSIDGALTAGKTSTGLSGSYSVESGLASVLDGTGLEAVHGPGNGYVLSRKSAPPAAAPAGDPAQLLPIVRVSAQAERGATTEGSHAYTSGAVTMGKGEQSLRDIPQSVSVLTRQRMDDQDINDLRTAVNNVTGVVGVQGVGPGLVITARGFQIDQWQYDGVPMPRNMYALGNWATEGMVFYDRVEVLRGASGLLQGTGSPGGAVNLVRKRGQTDPIVTLTGKLGSWDHYGLQLDAGGPLNADRTLRGRLVLDEDQTHSYIESAYSRTRSMYAALDYDIARDTTVGLGISNTENNSRPMQIGLPRYTDGSDIGLPRSTYTGSWWNRASSNQTTLFLDLKHRFNDRWAFSFAALNMQERNASVHQRMAGAVTADGSGVSYGDFGVDFNSEKFGFDSYLRGSFEALSLEHDVMIGANYSKYTSTDRFARAWTSGGNIFAIDHDRPWQDYDSIAARGSETASRYAVYQKGLYGTWRTMLAEPLTAIVGARLSWFDQLYADASSQETMSTSAKVTPYAGLVFALNKQWSAYASYTDVFEPQSARALGGSMLQPIIGANYELGMKGELLDGKVNTAFALFRYDQRNRAVSDIGGGFACDGWYCSRASGKVRSQGLEAEVSGEVLRGLQLFAGYAYTTTKYLEDPDNQGKVFSTWTPKHMLRLWADYQLRDVLPNLSIGGGVTTQSNTLSYDGALAMAGFSIWSARVGYQLTRDVSLALNVNNLFDKRYYVPSYNTIDSNNNYGTPRNVMLTVKYTPRF